MQTKKPVLYKILNQGERYLAAVLCIAIICLLFLQVVTRFVFRFSFTWTEELSVILFVWMSYLSIACAVTANKHIRVDFVIKLFPYTGQKVMFLIDNLLTMAYCAIMAWGVYGITARFYKTGASTLLLNIPKWVCYGIIPIGLALTIIRFVQNSITLIKAKGEPLNKAKPVIDVEALEKEYLESLEAKKAKEEK